MRRTTAIRTFAALAIAGAGAAGFLVGRSRGVGETSEAAVGPVANRDLKADRLAQTALAAMPTAADPASPSPPLPIDVLRQAYAAVSPLADRAADDERLPALPPIKSPPLPSPRPQIADLQQAYTLLSDSQIAALKRRLQLSAAQEQHWAAVEQALRALARKLHAMRQADPRDASLAKARDTPEMERLKTAATPLLAQLREDQKREVRALARVIGLDAIAARL